MITKTQYAVKFGDGIRDWKTIAETRFLGILIYKVEWNMPKNHNEIFGLIWN